MYNKKRLEEAAKRYSLDDRVRYRIIQLKQAQRDRWEKNLQRSLRGSGPPVEDEVRDFHVEVGKFLIGAFLGGLSWETCKSVLRLIIEPHLEGGDKTDMMFARGFVTSLDTDLLRENLYRALAFGMIQEETSQRGPVSRKHICLDERIMLIKHADEMARGADADTP